MSKFIECRHIMPSGRKCRAAALRGKPFCFHHAKLHSKPVGREPRMLKTQALDDQRSLRIAVAEALSSLRSPLTDPRRAAVILYGLNLANNLIKQMRKEPHQPAKPMTEMQSLVPSP